MAFTLSPLRYPGGKTKLLPFIRKIMIENGLEGAAYVEPFAGGAGIAWALLLEDMASEVHLNDLDQAVSSFWKCARDESEDICRLIRDTRVNMTTWNRQREVMKDPSAYTRLELAFATFFLNRTNRAGVIRGGPIGGRKQSGTWKITARYNKRDLIRRIERIAALRSKIHLYEMEAKMFIRTELPSIAKRSLVFIDPPYVTRGRNLYLDVYDESDHLELIGQIRKVSRPWVVSYDDAAIARKGFRGMTPHHLALSYSVMDRYVGSELLYCSSRLRVPPDSVPQYPLNGRPRGRTLKTKLSVLDARLGLT